MKRSRVITVAALVGALLIGGGVAVSLRSSGEVDGSPGAIRSPASTRVPRSPAKSPGTTVAEGSDLLPGMPPPLDPRDIYAADRPGRLSRVVRDFPERVYVPNSKSNTVDVIDPATNRVIDHFAVGNLPQHVVPSYDLKTLWDTNDLGNTLTPIDPATGRHGEPVPVTDPYNMYFTPDGRYAVVVAERLRRLDFRDPHTMTLLKSVPVDCKGVDHIDFSADGRYLIATCEFSGKLVKLDVATQSVLGYLVVDPRSMPQDIKLSPDGSVFYVADQVSGGVYLIDGEQLKVIGFVRTGAGAHGLYASRDSKYLYVTNRRGGSVSLISFATRKVARVWHIPGGGTPDMGGVSADGSTLWLAGRYSGVVYALDTRTGALKARIRVGTGPHGLCVYPQPGRYSLGHTGVFR